jgi:hypothetical protein
LYKEFDDATRVFVGHDYAPGGRALAWETTIGAQKRDNKHLRENTTEEEVNALRACCETTLSNLLRSSLRRAWHVMPSCLRPDFYCRLFRCIDDHTLRLRKMTNAVVFHVPCV